MSDHYKGQGYHNRSGGYQPRSYSTNYQSNQGGGYYGRDRNYQPRDGDYDYNQQDRNNYRGRHSHRNEESEGYAPPAPPSTTQPPASDPYYQNYAPYPPQYHHNTYRHDKPRHSKPHHMRHHGKFNHKQDSHRKPMFNKYNPDKILNSKNEPVNDMKTVYVEDVHPSLTLTDITKLFNTIGTVKDVQLFMNDLGNPFKEGASVSKQCALVTYDRPEQAYKALKTFNWLKVKDLYRFRVGLYNHRYKVCDNPALQSHSKKEHYEMKDAHPSPKDAVDSESSKEMKDEEVVHDPNLTANPTRNVKISNVFDPHVDTLKPQWDTNLLRAVQLELQKHGELSGLNILPSKGDVLVQYAEIPSSLAAVLKFHRRYFNGRQLSACFVDDDEYQKEINIPE